MYLDKTKKQEIFTQFGHDQKAEDTGSAESQIALFTYRIKHLTEHVKKHHKDFVTTRSLTQLVGKRRALLVHSARFPFRESARKLTFASFEMSIIPFQRSKDWE